MESARVRCLHKSCWRVRNRKTERGKWVRFLIQKQRILPSTHGISDFWHLSKIHRTSSWNLWDLLSFYPGTNPTMCCSFSWRKRCERCGHVYYCHQNRLGICFLVQIRAFVIELFWKKQFICQCCKRMFVALWVCVCLDVCCRGQQGWRYYASKHDIAALKVKQGHFETAIFVLHNFVVFYYG